MSATALLGPIGTVTVATADPAALAVEYERWLGYGVVERRAVSEAEARAWGAPGVAGRPQVLLAPAGRGDSYLRFVESRRPPGYVPLRHLGWNAAEHIVQDCDAVARQLAGSPFEIIGPPADLSFSDQIRAMQVRGPADEVLYLTQIKSKLPIFDTPDAEYPVDRVFIVILGGATMEGLQDAYASRFGVPRAPVIPSKISVLANAYGAPADTLYSIAALPLRGQSFIEADAMPAAAEPRPCLPGELPPAIAIVSFEAETLPAGVEWLAPPAALPGLPYRGRLAGTCRGPAGELVEVIARG